MAKHEDSSADIDFDELSDDEPDELFRPRKMNSRKALAPLFLFQILKSSSSPEKHLSQQELIKPRRRSCDRRPVFRVLSETENTF